MYGYRFLPEFNHLTSLGLETIPLYINKLSVGEYEALVPYEAVQSEQHCLVKDFFLGEKARAIKITLKWIRALEDGNSYDAYNCHCNGLLSKDIKLEISA